MIEAAVVLFGVLLLGALGVAIPVVPPEWWLDGGFAAAAVGMAVGVPTGFWYHVLLRRSLARLGPLPERWWLRPVSFHERVPADELAVAMRWFKAGGAGFLVTLLGCGCVVLGVVVQAQRAGLI